MMLLRLKNFESFSDNFPVAAQSPLLMIMNVGHRPLILGQFDEFKLTHTHCITREVEDSVGGGAIKKCLHIPFNPYGNRKIQGSNNRLF